MIVVGLSQNAGRWRREERERCTSVIIMQLTSKSGMKLNSSNQFCSIHSAVGCDQCTLKQFESVHSVDRPYKE